MSHQAVQVLLIVWQLIGLGFNVGAVLESTKKKRFYLVTAGCVACGMQVLLLLEGLHLVDTLKGFIHA